MGDSSPRIIDIRDTSTARPCEEGRRDSGVHTTSPMPVVSMTYELTKGANAALEGLRVDVVLQWRGRVDVDVAALLCSKAGKVRRDDDFVFFNQPRHASGAAWHGGKDRSDVSTDRLCLDLSMVEPDVEKIVISGSADGGNFGELAEMGITIVDASTATAQLCFPVSGATVETAMILGEFYRRDGRWKFRAVGQGYSTGLRGLATDFGISVDDSPPAPAPAASPPAPTPTRQVAPPNPASTNRRPAGPSVAAVEPTSARVPVPAARPAAVSGAPKIRRTPAPVAQRPSLQVAADESASLHPQWQDIINQVDGAANQILQGVLYSHSDLSEALHTLASTRSALQQAYQTRFGQPAPSYGGSSDDPNRWVNAATSAIGRLRNDVTPWGEKKRKAWGDELRSWWPASSVLMRGPCAICVSRRGSRCDRVVPVTPPRLSRR